MSIIYCDESGNSGEKLIDKEQPFFVLASNDFGRYEALELLDHVRSGQGGEPKFKTLKKTQDGIGRLTRLFADPRINKNRVVVDVYHKRYMVVTKMVDLIVETLYYEMGGDLYKRGANIAMSNMLYYCMPVYCGEELTNKYLQSFVDLMRNRTGAHVDAFFAAGRAMVDASSNEKFKTDLLPFTEQRLFNAWFEGINSMALDPAIPALFQHIGEWGKRKANRFRIIHDGSKPILASQEAFENMMAMNGETSGVVGFDRRKYIFPLRAISLEQGNSTEHPQIQLADICAGAINYFLKCREDGELDDLAIMIRDLCCVDWVINGVIPHPDVSPEALGTDSDDGVNPVDILTAYLSNREKNKR